MYIKVFDKIPKEAREIRETVFVKEQGFKEEFDEKDNEAEHVLLFEEDVPVATCRFFFSKERKCYIIGRIAVCKEFRGKRCGKKILEETEQIIQNRQGSIIELSAQCRVSDFYKKQGYTEWGNIHMDEGCPHIWMRKELTPSNIY